MPLIVVVFLLVVVDVVVVPLLLLLMMMTINKVIIFLRFFQGDWKQSSKILTILDLGGSEVSFQISDNFTPEYAVSGPHRLVFWLGCRKCLGVMAKEKSLHLPGIEIILFDLDISNNTNNSNGSSSSLNVFNSRSSRSNSSSIFVAV